MYAFWRCMSVEEGLDVDNNLLAHVDASLKRSRAHVRQCHDAIAGQELRVDRRLVLENVESGSGNGARFDHAGELVFIDDFATRRIDDIGRGLQQLETTG